MSAERVLSVGQCVPDHFRIAGAFRQLFGTEVVPSDSSREALEKLRQERFALVLVNRIFDADGSDGLELIRQIKADEKIASVPVMLVSNYDDAQAEAVGAGAVPGFGKATLGDPEMLEHVRPFLANSSEG
jgi:CheY-like chemotaxis protein